jgi:hypothetical protein
VISPRCRDSPSTPEGGSWSAATLVPTRRCSPRSPAPGHSATRVEVDSGLCLGFTLSRCVGSILGEIAGIRIKTPYKQLSMTSTEAVGPGPHYDSTASAVTSRCQLNQPCAAGGPLRVALGLREDFRREVSFDGISCSSRTSFYVMRLIPKDEFSMRSAGEKGTGFRFSRAL